MAHEWEEVSERRVQSVVCGIVRGGAVGGASKKVAGGEWEESGKGEGWPLWGGLASGKGSNQAARLNSDTITILQCLAL